MLGSKFLTVVRDWRVRCVDNSERCATTVHTKMVSDSVREVGCQGKKGEDDYQRLQHLSKPPPVTSSCDRTGYPPVYTHKHMQSACEQGRNREKVIDLTLMMTVGSTYRGFPPK